MICIFVNRTLSPAEIDKIRDLRSHPGYKFLYFNKITMELLKMGFEKFELPPEVKSKINKETINTILEFGDKKHGEKRVSDIMDIGRSGVWYYQRFRTYFYLLELMYEKAAIESISSDFDKVVVYSGENDLFESLAANKKIEFNIWKESGKVKKDYVSYFNYLLLVIVRSVLSFFRIKRLKKINHIVLDHAIPQSCLDIKTMKVKKDNYILSYLFENLDKDFMILNFTQIPKILSGGKFRITKAHFYNQHKRITRFYGEYVLFRAVLSSGVRKQLKQTSSLLINIYKQLDNSELSLEESVILSHYRKLHKSTMFYMLKYYAYNRFFSKFNFRTISGIDENSPGVKSILDAAKNNGMVTIGLQHGAISDLSVAYRYSLADREKKSMCDHTLVWGDKWKDLLVNTCNYPQESVSVTGQIRTDIIPRLLSMGKTGVADFTEPDHNLVVFASQPQPDARLREQAARDVFSAVRDMEKVFLIVKLHPGERNDKNYYHELAKQSHCSNYKLVINVDLFLLLSVCDILITCYSTVGTETAYFNKPLIIHDPLKLDMQSYHKDGIAFQATNEVEMKEFIRKILSKEIGIDQAAYNRFISMYAYKIDGKASERCLQFIRKF